MNIGCHKVDQLIVFRLGIFVREPLASFQINCVSLFIKQREQQTRLFVFFRIFYRDLVQRRCDFDFFPLSYGSFQHRERNIVVALGFNDGIFFDFIIFDRKAFVIRIATIKNATTNGVAHRNCRRTLWVHC
ncbi:hypothetical protein D3C87_1206430 [compost metagenome]